MLLAWLIRRWKACDKVARMSLLGGAVIGAAVSWWLNQPTPPWIEFHDIHATYQRGGKVVLVVGEYTANRQCSRKEMKTGTEAPDPLVWRQEVRGTGAEVVQYAPSPGSPSLDIGRHEFSTTIPLATGISPDGWSISLLISCDLEPYAVRSKSTPVKFLPLAAPREMP